MFEGKPRIVSKIESAHPEGMVRWSVIFTPLIMYYIMMKTKNIPIIRYKRNKCDISLKIYPISLA